MYQSWPSSFQRIKVWYCFTTVKFELTGTRILESKTNSFKNVSHEKYDHWQRKDQECLAQSVLTKPLYDFVLDNLALDMGQIKLLAAGNKNIKTEKGVQSGEAVEEQGEAIIVDPEKG